MTRPSTRVVPVDTDEERIALFLDYENLAIGARDALGGLSFDLKPVLDALAERAGGVRRIHVGELGAQRPDGLQLLGRAQVLLTRDTALRDHQRGHDALRRQLGVEAEQ